MTKTILVSAIGLLFGCQSPSKQAAKHEQKASEERQEAQQDLTKGRLEADQERNKIDQTREPVAGRDDSSLIRDSLQDKLGDDWLIERSGAGWLAARKNATKADKDLSKKLNDEMKSLPSDHKNVTVSYARGEVILRGQVDDCDDIGKSAEKFAKIDGVKKILVEISCTRK